MTIDQRRTRPFGAAGAAWGSKRIGASPAATTVPAPTPSRPRKALRETAAFIAHPLLHACIEVPTKGAGRLSAFVGARDTKPPAVRQRPEDRTREGPRHSHGR